MDVHFADSYNENVYNASFTKEAASKPAAIGEDMQGTFTGNNGYSTNYTVKVNADSIEYSEVDETWGVNIKTTITEYTIEDGGYSIAWTRNGVNYKFSSPMSGIFKLYIGSDNYTLTKGGAEPAQPANAFVGTWSGKIGTANWTIIFNADGTFTANGTTYHYVIDSTNANKAESTEADGSDKIFKFTIQSNGKLRAERYDVDACETFMGDLVKA